MENLHLEFITYGLFTAIDIQDLTLSYNVNLHSALENILWSYLAHLGHMRITTTTISSRMTCFTQMLTFSMINW